MVIEYWTLSAVVEFVRVRAVVCSIGKGQKFFLSCMWLGSVDKRGVISTEKELSLSPQDTNASMLGRRRELVIPQLLSEETISHAEEHVKSNVLGQQKRTLANSILNGFLASELLHHEWLHGSASSHGPLSRKKYTTVWQKVKFLKKGDRIATADGWEEIVSITKGKREQVFDIEVDGTHTFIGNGIVAHNTSTPLSAGKISFLKPFAEYVLGLPEQSGGIEGPRSPIAPLLTSPKVLLPSLEEMDSKGSFNATIRQAFLSGVVPAANPIIELGAVRSMSMLRRLDAIENLFLAANEIVSENQFRGLAIQGVSDAILEERILNLLTTTWQLTPEEFTDAGTDRATWMIQVVAAIRQTYATERLAQIEKENKELQAKLDTFFADLDAKELQRVGKTDVKERERLQQIADQEKKLRAAEKRKVQIDARRQQIAEQAANIPPIIRGLRSLAARVSIFPISNTLRTATRTLKSALNTAGLAVTRETPLALLEELEALMKDKALNRMKTLEQLEAISEALVAFENTLQPQWDRRVQRVLQSVSAKIGHAEDLSFREASLSKQARLNIAELTTSLDAERQLALELGRLREEQAKFSDSKEILNVKAGKLLQEKELSEINVINPEKLKEDGILQTERIKAIEAMKKPLEDTRDSANVQEIISSAKKQEWDVKVEGYISEGGFGFVYLVHITNANDKGVAEYMAVKVQKSKNVVTVIQSVENEYVMANTLREAERKGEFAVTTSDRYTVKPYLIDKDNHVIFEELLISKSDTSGSPGLTVRQAYQYGHREYLLRQNGLFEQDKVFDAIYTIDDTLRFVDPGSYSQEPYQPIAVNAQFLEYVARAFYPKSESTIRDVLIFSTNEDRRSLLLQSLQFTSLPKVFQYQVLVMLGRIPSISIEEAANVENYRELLLDMLAVGIANNADSSLVPVELQEIYKLATTKDRISRFDSQNILKMGGVEINQGDSAGDQLLVSNLTTSPGLPTEFTLLPAALSDTSIGHPYDKQFQGIFTNLTFVERAEHIIGLDLHKLNLSKESFAVMRLIQWYAQYVQFILETNTQYTFEQLAELSDVTRETVDEMMSLFNQLQTDVKYKDLASQAQRKRENINENLVSMLKTYHEAFVRILLNGDASKVNFITPEQLKQDMDTYVPQAKDSFSDQLTTFIFDAMGLKTEAQKDKFKQW